MDNKNSKARGEPSRAANASPRELPRPTSVASSSTSATLVADAAVGKTSPLLRETHELLRTIVSRTPIVIWALNSDGDFTLSEGKALELLGLEPGEAVGHSVYDIYRDVPEVGKNMRRALAGETVVATVDIDGVFFETWQSPLRNAVGDVIGVVGLAVDVTRRHRAETEVKLEHRLMRQMLRSHERDRQLVAYEIHDGMVQHAAAAKMRLDTILETAKGLSPDVRREIELASQSMASAIAESRQLINGLRPPVLEEKGVVAAIEYLIGQQPEGGPAYRFEVDVRFERLDPVVEDAIFRIVQEAITNIRRHARTDRVEIHMAQRDGWIRLEIRDWGVGFDPESVAATCFGLQGMRERSRLLGGRTEIKSAPGEGARVTVELPLVPSFGEEVRLES